MSGPLNGYGRLDTLLALSCSLDMSKIDPHSPLQIGHDGKGAAVALGEIDSYGTFVGYIDADSVCWESRQERDLEIGACKLAEAWRDWNRSGNGCPPSGPPDERATLKACAVLGENEDGVLELFHESLEMMGEVLDELGPES